MAAKVKSQSPRPLSRLASIEALVRLGFTQFDRPQRDSEAYRFTSRLCSLAPIVSGNASARPVHDLPTWEEEKDRVRFPKLNRKGSRLGRYCDTGPGEWQGKPTRPAEISSTDAEEWQDRMTQLRQFARLAGISMTGKDYSREVSARARGKVAPSKGPEFNVEPLSHWDGGKFDAKGNARRMSRLALHFSRDVFIPWAYDARGKLRSFHWDKARGCIVSGKRGAEVTVPELVAAYEQRVEAERKATDADADLIRLAASVRDSTSRESEISRLMEEQRQEMREDSRHVRKVQRKDRGLHVSIRDLTS